MRVIPKEWRREGVVECLKNEQIAAIVEEAEYAEAVKQGYYDEDGNWIYYETEYPEETVPEPPKQPQVPQQNQQQQPKPQQQQQINKDEVKAEAAKAAQEAAKAASEAKDSLVKGLTGFGFGGGSNKKQSSGGGGGFLGGLMKAAATIEPVAAPAKKEPPKPKVKAQDPKFPKPYTNNMTAKQRWQWAYRRIVQVFEPQKAQGNHRAL